MLIGTPRTGTENSRGESESVPPWAAPLASEPVDAVVTVQGSKSLTGRELLLSSLASGPGSITGALHSRDSQLMRDALTQLGTSIRQDNETASTLHVTPAEELTGPASINCGLAGTVMRFVPPVAALALGPISFDGDPYARKRPMAPLISALRQLGADIADDGRGTLPFTVHGFGGLTGGECEIDASLSSQFVSALLLSGARYEQGVTVRHTGERVPSLPHIDMTLESLRQRGVAAYSPEPGVWRVAPGQIAPRNVHIEPDLSNAAPFLAAALATGGSVRVPHWPLTTTQVGDELRELLPAFGAIMHLGEVDEESHTATLTANGPADGKLRGVTLHIPTAGELAPTLIGLAALAAHGTGKGDGEGSTFTGIGHIRHHETDRIAALVSEINRLGGHAEELEDGIRVHPATLSGGMWHCYADHRMATTGALVGLRVPGVMVEDIACTSKTLPTFAKLWKAMLEDGRQG